MGGKLREWEYFKLAKQGKYNIGNVAPKSKGTVKWLNSLRTYGTKGSGGGNLAITAEVDYLIEAVLKSRWEIQDMPLWSIEKCIRDSPPQPGTSSQVRH